MTVRMIGGRHSRLAPAGLVRLSVPLRSRPSVSSIQSLDNSVLPSVLGSNAKRRVYWYIQK